MEERRFEGGSAAEAAIRACDALSMTRRELKYTVVAQEGEGLARRVTIAVAVPAASQRPTLEMPADAEPVRGRRPRREAHTATRPPEGSRGGGRRRPVGDEVPRAVGDEAPRPVGDEAPRAVGVERHGGGDHQRGGGGRRARAPSEEEGEPPAKRRRRGAGGSTLGRASGLVGTAALSGAEPEGWAAEGPLAPARPSVAPRSPRAGQAVAIVAGIVRHMGLDVQVQLSQEDPEELWVELFGPDQARVIGHQGETLLALQFVANRMLDRADAEGEPTNQILVCDAGNYRGRRLGRLEELARELAGRVLAQNKAVRLSPMSAFDRRIFHLALKDTPEVMTRSEGEGLLRSLLIIPSAASL